VEFQKRYAEELRADPGTLARLKQEAGRGPVTLLYGAHDEAHNQAVVLGKILRRR
jgi:uncharacterized protein YeaO (DUF488 family)